MLAQLQEFPDTLFPQSGTKWKGKTVVDVGVNDAVDIVVEDKKIELNSRKRFWESYSVKHKQRTPCLPLGEPNDWGKFPIVEEVNDYSICQHEHQSHVISTEVKTKSKAHLNKLLIDRPELLLGTTIDELNQFNLDLLHRNFHPLTYACDIPIWYSKRVNPPEDYRKFFKETSHAKRRALVRFSNKRPLESNLFVKKLDNLWDAVFEIPKSTLVNYLDEELVLKYDELTENYHLGNCLATFDNYIIHPKGALDSVCITPIKAKLDRCDVVAKSTKAQNVGIGGRICEVICMPHDDNSVSIGLRSDYSCSFLSNSTKTFDKKYRYFDTMGDFHTESRVLAFSISPYFSNEAFILLEDGTLNLWANGCIESVGGKMLMSCCSCCELHWVNCIHGQHPRSVLFIHSEDAFSCDLRAPKTKPSTLILQLPNSYLNRMDKLTRPAALHPSNSHQILLTSEQGLIVMDDRFLRSPLITINHYMRSSPQFLQTLTNEEESAVQTLAFVGGYRYRDTRCIEFEQQLARRPTFFNKSNEDMMTTQPPVCVRPPWKLASPDSWLKDIKNDSRITSPGIRKRLRQPLIGLSVMKLEASSTKDLMAVQMTKCGDLFYQLLSTRTDTSSYQNECRHRIESGDFVASGDDASENSTRKVSEEWKTRFRNKTKDGCMKWIAKAYEMYNENKEVNETASLSFKMVDTRYGDIKKALDSQMESRECFKEAQIEAGGCFEAINRVKANCSSADYQYDESGMEGAIEKSCDARIKGTPDAVGVKQKGRKEFVKNCCLCSRPLKEEDENCDGCHLNIVVSNRLKTAYEKNCFLSNQVLGRKTEVPDLRLVKYPEKSKDPLSEVLLTNWKNDEFYTPIVLTDDEQDGCKNDTDARKRKKSSKSEFPPDEVEDFDQIEDGWYLSSAGVLEFGKDEAAQAPAEKTRPVTRSRMKRASKSTGKSESRVKRLNKEPSGKKSELENQSVVDRVENWEERKASLDNSLPVEGGNMLPSAIEMGMKSRDLEAKVTDGNSKRDVLSMPETINKSAVLPETTSPSHAHYHNNLDMSYDLFDATPVKGQQSKLQISNEYDDTPYSLTYGLGSMNTPANISSPMKGHRTPRKKKIFREMGF